MIVDVNLQLSGALTGNPAASPQTVTGTNTSVISTNAIDLLQNRDIGEGQDIYGRVQLVAAASGGTSVEFQAIYSDDAASTTNVTVAGSSGAIPVASLTAGSRFAFLVNPRLRSVGQRYLAIRYVLVGAVTAGTYVADIGIEVQDGQKFYPSGFAVL